MKASADVIMFNGSPLSVHLLCGLVRLLILIMFNGLPQISCAVWCASSVVA